MLLRIRAEVLQSFEKYIATERSVGGGLSLIVYRDDNGVFWNSAGFRMLGFAPEKIEPFEE